jgi:cyclophilin family peptidyl-prolyl cis-trans isomerase
MDLRVNPIGSRPAAQRRVRLLLLALLLAGGGAGPAGAQEKGGAGVQKADGIAAIDAFIGQHKVDKADKDWKLKLAKPPKVAFDPARKLYWLLDTNVGSIKLLLYPDIAPMHVSSTIYLTRLGFYDGTPFHRVIPGFMAQGGDPLGVGRGGPGYQYDGEFGSSPKAKHRKAGILSMANAGPGTDGSQFFLTFQATPHLDGKHTVFGEVVEGDATLQELERRGSASGRPVEPLQIRKATIAAE